MHKHVKNINNIQNMLKIHEVPLTQPKPGFNFFLKSRPTYPIFGAMKSETKIIFF